MNQNIQLKQNPITPVLQQLIKLQDYAHLLRIDSISSTNISKTGHPTSCSSIAQLISCLFFSQSGMKYNPQCHYQSTNDRLILSKGHAAPILYSALGYSGMIPHKDIYTLRLKDSYLQGHPVPSIPFIDVATGSLGQGLGVAAGMAYSSKYYDKINNYIWCILGDGQIAEGSIWQAASFCSYYQLNNVISIVDVNRLGQSQQTAYSHDVQNIALKWKSFKWNVINIDGHNIQSILNAFKQVKQSLKLPTVIIAKTFKGKYFPDIQNKLGFHGTAVSQQIIQHLKNLLSKSPPQPCSPFKVKQQSSKIHSFKCKAIYNNAISTRKAYGNGLVSLNDQSQNIISLDADVKNSTFAITLQKHNPHAFIQCFIAEQNMLSVAMGLSCRNKIPFVSTFGAFLTRAADQIRILGISNLNVKMIGSHSGVSIGQDGPSQMALQDIAFFRTIPNLILLYPSDGYSCQYACTIAANYIGPVYIRTARMQLQNIYKQQQQFNLGISKVVIKHQHDVLCIVTGGPLLHEAISVAKRLQEQKINIKVIDIFSIKPLDSLGLIKGGKESNNIILTVQQHYAQGGIYQSVAGVVINNGINVYRMCVEKIPWSAKPKEQLQLHGLSNQHIYKKVKSLI